jgi:hypothetical protein
VKITHQPGSLPTNGYTGQTDTVCTLVGSSDGVTISNTLTANVTLTVTCVQPIGFAYVTNAGDDTVSSFLIGSSGALVQFGSAVNTAPFCSSNCPASNYPVASAVGYDADWGQNVLVVANQNSNELSIFLIDPNTGYPTGSFSLSGGDIAKPSSVTYAGHPGGLGDGGQALFYITNSDVTTTDAGANSIFALALTSPGNGTNNSAYSFPTGSPFAAGDAPTTAVASPASSFSSTGNSPYFYAANFVDDTLSAWTVGSQGALSVISGSPFSGSEACPCYMATIPDPENNAVFVAYDDSTSSSMSVYSVNTYGGLTDTGNWGYLINAQSQNRITLGPLTGLFFMSSDYLLECTSEGLSLFNVVDLEPVLTGSVAAGQSCGAVAAIGNGATAYVFTTDPTAGNVLEFSSAIPTQGTSLATPSATGSVPSGTNPSSITITPRPNASQ